MRLTQSGVMEDSRSGRRGKFNAQKLTKYMKRVTKEELVERCKELAAENEQWKYGDLDRRKYLTRFISREDDWDRVISYRDGVLDWPEIYFQIGQLKERAKKVNTILEMESVIVSQKHLISRMEHDLRKEKKE